MLQCLQSLTASSMYTGSISKPANEHPNSFAAKAVVPRPKNGSNTNNESSTPPCNFIHLFGSSSGNVEGCGLSLSLDYIVSYGMYHLSLRSAFIDVWYSNAEFVYWNITIICKA